MYDYSVSVFRSRSYRFGASVICLAAALALPCAASGQGTKFNWARQLGGTDTDFATDVACNSAGHVFTVGAFGGTLDADPWLDAFPLTSAGAKDLFLSELDADGYFVGAWNIAAGSSDDWYAGVCVDSKDNVYVTGSFAEPIDVDPTDNVHMLSHQNGASIFISKFNASRELVWVRQIDVNDYGARPRITVDEEHNLYVATSFYGIVDFDPGPGREIFVTGATSAAVLKFSPAGTLLWSKIFWGDNTIAGADVAVSRSGRVYVVASFAGTADLDPGPGTDNQTAYGVFDTFVAKLTPNGKRVWSRILRCTEYSSWSGIAVDRKNNVFVAGQYSGTIDLNPAIGVAQYAYASGYQDSYVAKLDSGGNLVWGRELRGPDKEEALDVCTDKKGNCYVSGRFYPTVTFGRTQDAFKLTSSGGYDAFIGKLNPEGDFVWAGQTVGPSSNEDVSAIVVDSRLKFYGVGYFVYTADFNPGAGQFALNDYGGGDAFVWKLANKRR